MGSTESGKAEPHGNCRTTSRQSAAIRGKSSPRLDWPVGSMRYGSSIPTSSIASLTIAHATCQFGAAYMDLLPSTRGGWSYEETPILNLAKRRQLDFRPKPSQMDYRYPHVENLAAAFLITKSVWLVCIWRCGVGRCCFSDERRWMSVRRSERRCRSIGARQLWQRVLHTSYAKRRISGELTWIQ